MSQHRLQAIRAAKAAMAVDYLIEPSPAVPGAPGRTLAFGSIPEFVCECVVISQANVDNPEVIARALECVLEAPPEHPSVITHSDWLSAVMGGPVTYLGEEPYIPVRRDQWGMPIREQAPAVPQGPQIRAVMFQ